MCLNVESSSCDTLCCAAYIYSSAGYKMSREPTLGKFGFFSMYMLLNFSESQPRRSDKKVIIKKSVLPSFDQQRFAEAKAYEKTGKIYCFSTFRGHRDSIIKRLVK